MDDDDFRPITKTQIFFATLVILFSSGSLWVATHGTLIARDISNTFFSEPNSINHVATVIGNVNPSDSPVPYTPSSTQTTSPSPTPKSVVSPTVSNSSQPQSMQVAVPNSKSIISTPTPSVNLIRNPISPINSSSPTPSATSKISSLASSSLTIMIGGDIMMDRTVRKTAQKNGYDSLFAGVTPLFKQADIVVANLEGPITSNPSVTLLPNGKTSKDLVFTFEPKSAQALANAGITIVDLANNHSYNFGSAGITETKKWLQKSGIKWFGDYRNSSSTEALINKNNIKVAFVGYHAFQPGFDRVMSNVKSLFDQGYFVIVMPHWGVEYATSSSPQMRNQARLLAMSGASAIVGSHPHVVLEHYYIGNVPVFFSIGNLLFDQYFSPEVMKGNIVKLQLSKIADKTIVNNIQIYETSTKSRTGVTVNMTPMDF